MSINSLQGVNKNGTSQNSETAKLKVKSGTPTEQSASRSLSAAPLGAVKDTFQGKKQIGFLNLPSIELTRLNVNYYDPVALASTLARSMYAQQLLHPTMKGNIKIILNNAYEPTGAQMQTFSLADNIALQSKPSDVLIKSVTGRAGLAAIACSTGCSFMLPRATIEIDPAKSKRSLQTTSDMQGVHWRHDQEIEALATKLGEKSGYPIEKRDKLLKLLKAKDSRKTMTSLEALFLGKSGIIDGVLLPGNRVITRANLDHYLQEKKLDKRQIKKFLAIPSNCSLIPSTALGAKFLDSVGHTLSSANASSPVNATVHPVSAVNQSAFLEKIPAKSDFPIQQHQLLSENITDVPMSNRYAFSTLNRPQSILSNDALFYASEVTLPTINTLIQQLKRLDEKRVNANSSQHIPLFVSSPGGNVDASNLYLDALPHLKTPVDIILNSSSSSAAIMMMLAGATGKKMATPNSWLMLHEGRVFGNSNAHELSDYMKKSELKALHYLETVTGRPLSELRKDAAKDYYLNPLEALFYGDKGLLDAVLVGANTIVTRKDAEAYLIEKLGSPDALKTAVKERLERRRDMNLERDRKYDVKDPFDNYFHTLESISKKTGHALGSHPDFKHSGPDTASKTIEHTPVKQYQSAMEILLMKSMRL